MNVSPLWWGFHFGLSIAQWLGLARSRSGERKLVLARVPFGAEERSDSLGGATKEKH